MARRTKKPLQHDPYWDVVQSLMKDIMYCYEQYREKKPVMLFDMQEHRALITASATLVLFSLPSGTPWWTEGRRRYLNGCPNRGTPCPRLLPDKPLGRRRPVRTCEQNMVHRCQARTLSGMVEPSQRVMAP